MVECIYPFNHVTIYQVEGVMDHACLAAVSGGLVNGSKLWHFILKSTVPKEQNFLPHDKINIAVKENKEPKIAKNLIR